MMMTAALTAVHFLLVYLIQFKVPLLLMLKFNNLSILANCQQVLNALISVTALGKKVVITA